MLGPLEAVIAGVGDATVAIVVVDANVDVIYENHCGRGTLVLTRLYLPHLHLHRLLRHSYRVSDESDAAHSHHTHPLDDGLLGSLAAILARGSTSRKLALYIILRMEGGIHTTDDGGLFAD